MRRTIVVAMIAAVGGFCVASVPALGALRYNIWSQSGEKFQLGYVVGYMEAVRLARQRDLRVQIPAASDKNFDRWVRGVNEFYAKAENQARDVPDAMFEVATQMRAEWLKNWQQRRPRKPAAVPSPSPAP